MNATILEQAATKVQSMAGNLSDDALCLAWAATEGQPATTELAMVRGWIMAELNNRLGDDLFDEWLMADSDFPDPLPFLARKGG